MAREWSTVPAYAGPGYTRAPSADASSCTPAHRPAHGDDQVEAERIVGQLTSFVEFDAVDRDAALPQELLELARGLAGDVLQHGGAHGMQPNPGRHLPAAPPEGP